MKPLPTAILTEDVHFAPDLTYFLQVKLQVGSDGKVFATPITGNGSGDLANLAQADAFLELPQDKSDFSAGESFPYIAYRDR